TTLSLEARLKRSPSASTTVFVSEFLLTDPSRFRRYGESDEEGGRPWTLAIVSFRQNALENTVWCGLQLTFKHLYQKKYVLEAASFLLLLGGTKLYPLLRAEWDYKDFSNKISQHAQPHWHVLVRPEPLPQETTTSKIVGEPFGGGIEFTPSGKQEGMVGLD